MAQQQQDLRTSPPAATTINNNNIQIQDGAKSFADSDSVQQAPARTETSSGRPEERPEAPTVGAEQPAGAADEGRHPEEQQQQQQQQRVPSQPQTAVLSQQPPANNRSILILREIDPDSSEESVRDLFNSENCPSKPVHCEYALHNSWYVTFKNDEDAKQALTFIRKYIITWNGQPIMARYKPKPAGPSASNQPPPNIMPQHMVMQQQASSNAGVVGQTLLQQQQQQVPPASLDTATTTTTTSLSHTAINESATLSSPTRQQAVEAPQAPGAATGAPPAGPNGLLIYQHPANHSMMQPAPHHHQMGLPGASLVHQHPGYGYSAVAYYGQHGPILTPYHHYANGPQYELSEVFIYNGLTPFPASIKANSSPSTLAGANGTHKLIINGGGGGGVSSAALLGGELPYHHPNPHQLSHHPHPHHPHPQHHPQHHNNHQHPHQHPQQQQHPQHQPLLGSGPTPAGNNGNNNSNISKRNRNSGGNRNSKQNVI